MCYPVTCPNCKKTTWDGCGSHVSSVMKSIPESRRCDCSREPTPAELGFFARILGR